MPSTDALPPGSVRRARLLFCLLPALSVGAFACSDPVTPGGQAGAGGGNGVAGSASGGNGTVAGSGGMSMMPLGGGGAAGGAVQMPTAGNASGGGGAGGGGAGAAGQAGMGGAGGGAAGGCAAAFCEDFEGFEDGAKPKNARWTSAQNLNDFVVDSLMPASGKHSLHLKYTSDGNRRWLRTTEPFEAGFPKKLTVQHFGRLRVFMKDIPPPDTYRHWITVALGGTDSPNIVKVLGGERTNGLDHYAAQIDIDIKDRVSDDLTSNTIGEVRRNEPNVPLVKGVWECFEWFYDSDKNSYKLWMDGKPMTGATWDPTTDETVPKTEFPEATQLFLAFWEYHNMGAVWDVFLDDLALDDKQIGCE